MPVIAGTQLGRYTIRSLLGAGGMGEVYLAQDTQLRRLIALKLLPADLTQNEDQLRRFEQEAYAASVLNHPNILTIYEIGQANNIHFIATEYIEGITLRRNITNTRMELSEVLDTAVQVASALVAAHQAGIVHRDIKPENIMIRHDGYVKVLDFGLAKLSKNRGLVSDPEAETMQAFNTEPGLVMGTVSYMSPEQTRGVEIDARTDIWSLGVVLYEMVAGRVPFDGPTVSDVIAAILKTEPFPLIRFSPKVPAKLQRIVTKALSKGHEERYQTMKDMLIDLKSLQRGMESEIEPEQLVETTETNSIAILPFRNLTNDEAVSFYEFSLADAVITELVRLRSLIVRPSSVVAKYLGQNKDPLEYGQELNVKAVLAASFLHTKNRVRVTAQLIDVASGDVLWGESIDSGADDIIAVQDIIVQRIVVGLQLKLSPTERIDLTGRAATNAHAYEQYLRGRDRMRRYVYQTVANEDIEAAIGHFKRAIELNPKFALAYCALGGCYINRIIKLGADVADLPRAQQALEQGLAYDPQIIEARTYLAFIHLLRGEKQKAREQLAELRCEAPNDANVYFLSAYLYRLDGEYDEALRSLEQMWRLNPTESAAVSYNRARIFMYQGRYDDALFELDRGETIAPNNPLIKIFRAVALFRRGEPATAAKMLSEVLASHPEKEGFRPYLAMCLSALGEHTAARAQLTEKVKKIASVDHDVPYWIASAYAMEGEYDEAFKWLERAINIGNENLQWFESNPVWESLRTDIRFIELMNRIKVRNKQRRTS